MDRKSRKNWFGVVFGLIFFIIGVVAAYGIAGKMVIGYFASNSWVEVPATIHDVNLVSSYGDDATTHRVESQYSYRFNGVSYQSNSVGLSGGSDSVGDYWQNLERSLRARQSDNEASAFVNPNNPNQSLLDRTLRWKSIVFGLLFLSAFGGVGGYILCSSWRGSKSRKLRLMDEQGEGISSDQKYGNWSLAAIGVAFFVMGVAMSVVVLPDAIRDGQYGALLVLLFVLLGASFICSSFKLNRAYRRFGPTPLFLNPSVPGVGGQLGGQFNLNLPGVAQKGYSSTQLQARLACVRRIKGRKTTRYAVEWQEEVLVYLEESANGVSGSFLFEIPENCMASDKWSGRSSIAWKVSVEGEFDQAGLGKFERSWKVVVTERAAQASRDLNIPHSFLEDAAIKNETLVKASALGQVPVTEDADYIHVQSKAGRNAIGKLIGMLFGAIFVGVGVFTIMQNWLPGYLFALIGGYVALYSLYILGKSIAVKIDKNSRVLNTQESWFGLIYANHQADVLNPQQFALKTTTRSSSQNKLVENCAVTFKADGKNIRIADGIEGEKQAQALIDSIVSRCFD